MKVRCLSCGASISLDVLIANDDAREAVAAVFKISGETGKAVLRYVALFRPPQRELTLARLAKLLNELVPDMQTQRITCHRQTYAAPPAAWVWAIEQVLQARDAGRLTLPLESHGYLYKVITSWSGQGVEPVGAGTDLAVAAMPSAAPATVAPSKTRQAAGSLASRAQAARDRDQNA